MQVFKVFFKILSKRITAPLIYVVIFIAIGIIMSTQSTKPSQFTDTKLYISVIDMDKSNASRSLIEFLSENHNVKETKQDHDKMLDDIYYMNTNYVLTIKKDFEKNLEQGKTDDLLSNYQIPRSYASSLVESQIDRYILSVKSYTAGGFSLDEAMSKTHDIMQDKTEVIQENFSKKESASNADSNTEFFFNIFNAFAYIFLAILISSLVPILTTLSKKDIKARINASCLSASKQTLQTGLASVIYAFVVWFIFMIIAIAMSCTIFFSKTGLYAMLNSFVFMIVALSLALFISSLSPSPKAIDMMANTISLAMSFLCGVFVPIEFLSDSIIKVAHFLPAYWYVKANNMLAGASGELFETGKFFSCIGIEFLFAAALFSLAMLVANVKRKSSSL